MLTGPAPDDGEFTPGELAAAQMANALEDLGRGLLAFREAWDQAARAELRDQLDDARRRTARIVAARMFLRNPNQAPGDL